VSRSPVSEGFTLIEVLIALVIVSVLVVGAAGLLNTASQSVRSSRLGTAATLLAVQKVEQLEGSLFALSTGTSQDYLAVDGTSAPATTAAFVRRWTVIPAWASSGNALVRVEVFASGAGRLVDLEAVVGGEEGLAP
jgi:prepilin-type N-terminal cleavage/methylation domain-containing protein